MDVGSGTGILCLFAAKAGARRCIGIECSDIAEFATAIARDNGFGETITYVQGKVEEVELPVERVDIIISEWMGYFLIYESMLDSVVFARDKWLAKDGLLFPDHARLYAAGIEDADYKEEKIGFWGHVWGFDFSPMQQLAMQEPISDTVEETAIVTNVACILELDLKSCRREDFDFLASYSLQVQRKDFMHALVVWFDVTFRACSPPVILSTAPGKPCTHWKQTVLYLQDAVVAEKGDILSGMIAVRKTEQNPRDLDVKVSFTFEGKIPYPHKVQYYRLR
uniref:Methyltransferase domain-containing protein n=1 Tax=Pyrodinium bahamense TaxID=73915 RepID=A0A7S0FAW1_9DINO